MATKKKTSAPKKTAGKKKNDSGVGGKIIAILIVLIIGCIVYYGLKETSEIKNKPIEVVDSSEVQRPVKKTTSSGNSENKSTQRQEEKIPSEKSSASETESDIKQIKKFDEKKINALDGVEESKKTNSALPEYDNETTYYYTSSFDFAWPTYTSSDQIIEHQYYALKYNERTEQADWVAYKLLKKNIANPKYKRSDNFRIDPQVSSESASPNDYKGSGYDRGHLAPAADFTWDETALDESFFMSNMSPQNPDFNRGIWKDLEELVRKWAMSNGEIFVVTGPVFYGKSEKIGRNKVAVPQEFYKVVLEMQGKEVKGIAFLISNEKQGKPISSYAMSIDQLEAHTGIDFFPSIPDDLEKKIESQFDFNKWQ